VKQIYLSFSDVHYSVTLNSGAKKRAKAALPKGEPKPPHWDLKHVLKGVSGVFAPGSLSAIMVRICKYIYTYIYIYVYTYIYVQIYVCIYI